MSFQNTSTKEANHEAGRPDHDFTQHSVIRSTNEAAAKWCPGGRDPLGKDPPDKGTATDYGCCVMAMDTGGVTDRTL
jgi:hypothetical protein